MNSIHKHIHSTVSPSWLLNIQNIQQHNGPYSKKKLYQHQPSFKIQTTTLPGKQARYNLNLSQFRQGQLQYLQLRKISSFLQPMMNDLAQKAPRMYSKCTIVDNAQWIQISNCILLQLHMHWTTREAT
jgi:hypothetical protein